MVLINKF